LPLIKGSCWCKVIMEMSMSKSPVAKAGVHARFTVPRRRQSLLKRPLDVFLSIFMLILSIPISLPIALALKVVDKGPIFYRQERWAKNGSRFRSYKFRTMVPNSDHDYGIKQASENDSRITRVGKILRATGLDELPQLLNIFKGDMSFVGPRSLAVGEIVRGKVTLGKQGHRYFVTLLMAQA